MDERQNDLPMDELMPQAAPEIPESHAAPVEESAYIPESYTAPVEESAYIPESYTAPVEESAYIPESHAAPAEEAAPVEQAAPVEEVAVAAPAKPKKKLNKKFLIAGIAAAAVIALVIVLVCLLGGNVKNYGFYIADGEINLYIDGMEEPVELSSRLWKDADNRYLAVYEYILGGLVAVRDNGNLVIYPDKFSPGEGATLYMRNANKPKEDPEKIDSGISYMTLSEDGSTILYYKLQKDSLHLVDLKKGEELFKEKDIASYRGNADLSRVCFKTDDNKLYIWTAKTGSVKVAKDVLNYQYFADTDVLFALTRDGELLIRTADMEEAEEIAENVSHIAAAYDSGCVYFIRESDVERHLLDYFEDDMADEDAAITQPKKPTYPNAPTKPYSWNYSDTAEYEAALAEYNVLYAEYQEEYNKLKNAYNEALEAYYAKQERDEIRSRLDRTVVNTEYALYCFNGTEEVLLSDNVTSMYVGYAADVPVISYSVYISQNVEKFKMSEAENSWSVANDVANSINASFYSETDRYIAQGDVAILLENQDATDVTVSADGSTVYYLDAPFTAFEDERYNTNGPIADAPAAAEHSAEEDEDAEEDEETTDLIPAEDREYASLYSVSVNKGSLGEPELLDTEVSYIFTPSVYADSNTIIYYKAVDSSDMTGELWCNGKFVADDVNITMVSVTHGLLLFYSDYDSDDRTFTLSVLDLSSSKAEAVEVADEVYDYAVTEAGDILFLQDYDLEDCEGTLMLFNVRKGKPVEVADDVVCLLIP